MPAGAASSEWIEHTSADGRRYSPTQTHCYVLFLLLLYYLNFMPKSLVTPLRPFMQVPIILI